MTRQEHIENCRLKAIIAIMVDKLTKIEESRFEEEKTRCVIGHAHAMVSWLAVAREYVESLCETEPMPLNPYTLAGVKYVEFLVNELTEKQCGFLLEPEPDGEGSEM